MHVKMIQENHSLYHSDAIEGSQFRSMDFENYWLGCSTCDSCWKGWVRGLIPWCLENLWILGSVQRNWRSIHLKQWVSNQERIANQKRRKMILRIHNCRG